MITLRRAGPSDLDTLLAFAEHTFRTAFQHLNDPQPFEEYCQEVFAADHFFRQMQSPDTEFWLAFEGDILAAYLKLIADQNPPELTGERSIYVERLYVEPSLQGRRIGEKMLEHALLRANDLGKDWVWLSVWQDTPAAVRFYERCGFERFGTEIFWLADVPQLDWLMRKRV